MLGLPHFAIAAMSMTSIRGAATSVLGQVGTSETMGALLPPVVILVLCVAAGIGTVLLLPGKREGAFRKMGGVVILAAFLILGALVARAAPGGVHIYFWIFSFIALAGALRVVTHPRPVYAALYFVLTVFATAGLFVLLWAEFMAAALILIYAGAILVTYVFVIMLAQQAVTPGRPALALTEYDAVSREPVVAAAVGFTLAGLLLFVIFDKAAGIERVPEPDRVTANLIGDQPTQALGEHLFRQHLVNLELASLILTVAMVGAIVIARRQVVGASAPEPEQVGSPATPINDDPHSIPVYGTEDGSQKAYPET